MKILVLGAGAIGGYYGARLVQAGADVRFLVRGRRAIALDKDGLKVRSPLGDFSASVRGVASSALDADYDVAVLACKSFDLEAAIEAVSPALRRGGVVLPLLNGLAPYDTLDTAFGKERVLGGVAYISVTLTASGEIVHSGAADRLIVGSRSPAAAAAARGFLECFGSSPGARQAADAIEQELWNKWVMISAGAVTTCLLRGSIGDIVSTIDGAALTRQAIAECSAVAARSGFELSEGTRQGIDAMLLQAGSPWVASMGRDMAESAPRIEAGSIVGDMVKRAERYGFDVPLTRIAYCNLQVYEARHRSAVSTQGDDSHGPSTLTLPAASGLAT